MKHEGNLVELLRPLGVYRFNEDSVNRGELGAYGRELDTVLAELELLKREVSLITAEGMGLDLIEVLLPWRPVSGTREERVQALAALLRIGGDSFTLAAINATLSGCGINARAEEGDRPGYVEVVFPHVVGIPAAFTQLRPILEEILPCHLEITYRFWFNTWAELAQLAPTWGDAQAEGKSWYGLAAWKD